MKIHICVIAMAGIGRSVTSAEIQLMAGERFKHTIQLLGATLSPNTKKRVLCSTTQVMVVLTFVFMKQC